MSICDCPEPSPRTPPSRMCRGAPARRCVGAGGADGAPGHRPRRAAYLRSRDHQPAGVICSCEEKEHITPAGWWSRDRRCAVRRGRWRGVRLPHPHRRIGGEARHRHLRLGGICGDGSGQTQIDILLVTQMLDHITTPETCSPPRRSPAVNPRADDHEHRFSIAAHLPRQLLVERPRSAQVVAAAPSLAIIAATPHPDEPDSR